MGRRRDDPYAILDERTPRSRREALVGWLVPMLVLVVFLAVMAYVAAEIGDHQVPLFPSGNNPMER